MLRRLWIGLWMGCLGILGGLVSATTAQACQGSECDGGRAGSFQFSFDSIHRASRAVRRYKIYYFHRKKCRVVGMYGSSATIFRRAVRHADKVLRDPYFRLLVRSKKNWQRLPHSAKKLLRKLRHSRTKVIANTFRRDVEFPCDTKGVDHHTNAFAPLGVPILFLSKTYLRRQIRRGHLGIRTLARTIIHETLHTLGYSHRGLRGGTKAYNNSVPVFVSCMVMNWPSKKFSRNASRFARQAVAVNRYCSLSSKQKKRTASFYVPWMLRYPQLTSKRR